MNNKDEIQRLETYINKLKDSLSSAVPSKHKNRVEQYKQYLTNEIEMHKAKIERMKLV